MKRMLYCMTLILAQTASVLAETKIDVFPPTPYDQATVYINLGFFWAGIIGLVILLCMKLRELERTQKMEREQSEKDAPLLE